jgi:hypothetical protein
MALAAQREESKLEIDEEDMPHVGPKELMKVWKMQKYCPFYFEPQFHNEEEPNNPSAEQLEKWTEAWEQSQLRKDLTKALELVLSILSDILRSLFSNAQG